MKNISIALLAFLIFQNSFASNKEERTPIGCRDLGYRYKLKALELLPMQAGTIHSMYFIYNKSDHPVRLYQLSLTNKSSGSYLTNQIHPKQWGVLSTSDKFVRFACTAIKGRKSMYGTIENCANLINVCEYNNVKYGMNNRGDYWIDRSNSKNGAIRSVVNYGIIPAS